MQEKVNFDKGILKKYDKECGRKLIPDTLSVYRNIMLVGVGVGVAATTIFHITVREETHSNRQQLTPVDMEKVSS